MFNKGLYSSKKQERLLKSFENIEDKADNQLLATEDQGNRILDLIHEINNRRNKSISFKNEKLKALEKELKDKEQKIRKNKGSKDKNKNDKAIFSYIATDGKEFDFTKDIKLLNLSEDLYKGNLTFDEAEEELKAMFKNITELRKRVNPRTGPKPKKNNLKNGKS